MRSRRRRRWVARWARSQSLRGSVRQARVPIVFENCSSRFADPARRLEPSTVSSMRRIRRMLLVILVVILAVVGVLVVGRMVRRNWLLVAEPGATAVATTKQTLPYGSSSDQTYDVWPAQGGSGPAPLVMFVHGGGWTSGSKDSAGGTTPAGH